MKISTLCAWVLATALGCVIVGRHAASAVAAPATASFEGVFDGPVPGGIASVSGIRIDRQGKIQYPPPGSFTGDFGYVIYTRLDGRVSSKGVMTVTGTQSGYYYGAVIDFKANVTLDAGGNILGVTTTGQTFVWTRH
jgi:hypothetical protein